MRIAPRIVQIDVGLPGTIGRKWSRLYIAFDIERTAGSTPNKAKVEIYNLAPASLTFLETPGMALHVLAGETVPGSLFYGALRKGGVKTKVSHPNQITTLEATDGKLIMQTGTFAGSYPAGTTRTQVLSDLLAANAIARGYIAPIPERVYQAPPTFGGSVDEVLDELYSGEQASWSLQDGAFQLLALGQAMPGNAPIISVPSGMIGSPERADKGVKVSTSQLGAVRPGGGFAIKSRMISGAFRCTSAHDKGDTELLWQSDLVGVRLAA